MTATRQQDTYPMYVLRHMDLPPQLIKWIKTGTLLKEIRAARRALKQLNAALDAWEASNPEAAALLPWTEARRAWKAAGSPEPEWWVLLRWAGECRWGRHAPITQGQFDRPYAFGTQALRAKKKALGLKQSQRMGEKPEPYKPSAPKSVRANDLPHKDDDRK